MSRGQTKRAQASGKRPRKQVILVFGENENDTKTIRELLVAIAPALDGKIRALPRPPLLIKDARPEDVPSRAATIAALIEVEQVSADVICVFAHEDCDDIEPAHEAVARKIEDALSSFGHHVHAVTPAWEMETWLFQWPGALAAVRPSWRPLQGYENRDLGRIRDAKEVLTRALRPTGRVSTRDYSETDSPRVAEKVRTLGIVSQRKGRCRSFDVFESSARECAEQVRE